MAPIHSKVTKRFGRQINEPTPNGNGVDMTHGAQYRKYDLIYKTGSTQHNVTQPEENRATAMHRNFDEV